MADSRARGAYENRQISKAGRRHYSTIYIPPVITIYHLYARAVHIFNRQCLFILQVANSESNRSRADTEFERTVPFSV